jgi:hypothetical protein
MYRTAYVVQNSGHDFQELKKICDNILFVTTGYEPENALLDVVIEKLKNFDPTRDVIVPVGNVAVNLLVGLVLNRMCFMAGVLTVAMYQDKAYHMRVVQVPQYVILPNPDEVEND